MSALEFRKPGFADDVARILAETEFPANRLKLEITETALIANVTSVKPALDRLRAMGIRLVLDDFGTGYSSLAYLRLFKLDGVKIDRAFVEDLGSAQDGYALLASIVALGHALGLEVTAEGIETERQKSLAITAGCDQLQGYLMGHATDHARLSQVIPAIAGPAFPTAARQNAAIGRER
jgi:EAL domain-containing protein (putative c-di-GMP-specific phosphodiesterase class I)